jgi:hypothetical protein
MDEVVVIYETYMGFQVWMISLFVLAVACVQYKFHKISQL